MKTLSHYILVALILVASNIKATAQWTTNSNGIHFNSGQVGIGNESPLYKLDVVGSIRASSNFYLNGNLILSEDFEHSIVKKNFGALGGDVETSEIKGRNIDLYAFDDVNIRAGVTDKITFIAGDAERLRITNNGNIGIGKLSPSAKLHVNGNIISKEIKVEDVDGADFVFAPDYNLMPLSQIESYIKQNHHLPEVPSAAEMEANGIELGKMNMLLLQKIEELTLHQIAQEKKSDRQSKIIEMLLLKLEAQEKEIAKINQRTNLNDN